MSARVKDENRLRTSLGLCLAKGDEPAFQRIFADDTAQLVDLLAKDGSRKAPDWVHLFPYGSWEGHPFGPIEINEAILNVMISNFDRSEIDVVIDYEHSTEQYPPDPDGAIAAGFVDAVEIRDSGLWGHIRYWTDKARERIETGEYRYLSPAWTMNYIDPATGADLGPKLLSVGLVNRPFFQELTPLAAKQKQEKRMDPETLKALGLKEGATADQIAKAVADMKAKAESADAAEADKKKAEEALAEAQKQLNELNDDDPEQLTDAVRKEFDLPEGATTVDLKAAKLKLQAGDPNLAGDVKAIKERLQNQETAALIAKYVKEGKITKAMLPDATALAKANPELFVKTFDNMPALNLAGEVAGGAGGGAGDDPEYELTDDDKFVAKQLGMSEADFKAGAIKLNQRLDK